MTIEHKDFNTWQKISNMLNAAMTAADTKEVRIAIVVLNSSGNVLASIAHSQASPMAMKMAQAKAFTSLSFGLQTSEVMERVDVGVQTKLATTDKRLLFLDGGVPIHGLQGVVGAIGVSGATPKEDSNIAKAALSAIDNAPGGISSAI